MVSQNLQPWYGNSVVFESHSLMFHLTKKRYIRTDRVVLAVSRVGQRNLYSEQYGNQAYALCFHAVSPQISSWGFLSIEVSGPLPVRTPGRSSRLSALPPGHREGTRGVHWQEDRS